MIRTFSFLNQVWNDPCFMEQVLHLLDCAENAELHTNDLILSFDAQMQRVGVRALHPHSEFAVKVIPKSISYTAMKKMLFKDFDHFLPGDISDMERYHKLSHSFYSLDLHNGKTHFRPGRNIMCFFIVEHPCTEAFILDQALQLLMTPCLHFDFYGACVEPWIDGFRLADHMLYPGGQNTDLSVINRWDALEQFADTLHQALSMRPLVPCDIFLIYDDSNLYRRVLEQLLTYDNIRKYHFDWQKIIDRL